MSAFQINPEVYDFINNQQVQGNYNPYSSLNFETDAGGTTFRRGGNRLGAAFRSGDIGALLDFQLGEYNRNRDEATQNRQRALSELSGSRTSNLGAKVDEVLAGLKTPDPNVEKVRTSIQSVLDNPNVIDEATLERLSQGIRNERLSGLDAAQANIRGDAAAAGIGRSGESLVNLANLNAQTAGQISNDITSLRAENERLTADNLARAQQLGTDLETRLRSIDSDLTNQLLQIEAQLAALDQDRDFARADLLSGNIYEPIDLSGIASLLVAQEGAREQGRFNDEQLELLREQLNLSREQYEDLKRRTNASANQRVTIRNFPDTPWGVGTFSSLSE